MRHSALQKSLLAFAAGASLLEGAAAAAESEGGASDKLEEIVVTARKREENLQSVPAAVTALTSYQLRELFPSRRRLFQRAADWAHSVVAP
jgi:outer membrane receptor protein involved in Fe transport